MVCVLEKSTSDKVIEQSVKRMLLLFKSPVCLNHTSQPVSVHDK